MISRLVTVKVSPAPAELAQEFCELDAGGMALFFNAVATFPEEWKVPFCFQLQALTTDPMLNNGGQYIMRQLGEYASKSY